MVEKINKQFKRGLISDEERFELVIKVWNDTTQKVSDTLTKNMDPYNTIFMMADSGARGSINQIRQLAGMRGLIANTSGTTIDIPIKANYHEGLNVLEYFISSRGARKGMADTALRTADSGYLTRRLVDVAQELIIREEDCHTTTGLEVCDITDYNEMIEPLKERLIGRYLLEDLFDSEGKLIASKDVLLSEKEADDIIKAGITKVKIRSILNCKSKHGICAKCYGSNLATGKNVTIGEAVGIIAAQSIGEPGTQLTMRNFHTGGIASAEDITQGLPRVEELFEARKPKRLAIISAIKGVVAIEEENNTKVVVVLDKETLEEHRYQIPYGSRITVSEGDIIEKGDAITEGSINPHDILEIKGELAVQDYLIQEVQKVYRLQGVDINDKHIEVIVRQMLSKVRVINSGSTDFLQGALIDKMKAEEVNKEINKKIENGEQEMEPANLMPILLGITKASLATESFLSAASFQETTRILTDAAIKGKEDKLIGLKENVIIGKLIPAGTGTINSSAINIIENPENDNI